MPLLPLSGLGNVAHLPVPPMRKSSGSTRGLPTTRAMRRRPVDRASDIVAQHMQAQLDEQADEAMAHEGWKQSAVSATSEPSYIAGLMDPATHSTPIGCED
jgi:hypothetical protein